MNSHKDGLEDRCKWRGKNEEKKWIYGIPINNHIGTFIIFEKNPHYCSMYNYMEIDEVENINIQTLGQYSGEKDKNEKEIYEGDFVELVLYDGPYDENDNPRRTIVEVVYNKDYHTLMFNPIEDSPCGFMYSINSETCKDCTIVGNKYDNPEIKKYGIKFIK